MSPIETLVPVSESAFHSLSALRNAHGELLRSQPPAGAEPGLVASVESFLRRGQATGALLDSPDDRWSAQSALDYWATVLYRLGRRDVDSVLQDFEPELSPVLAADLCPYVGLAAFREGDHKRFFGRTGLIGRMVAHLRDGRLLAASGPSGGGKSSVVLGGLLPALAAGALPGSKDWRYLPTMVPGSEPLRNLARTLLPAGAEPALWITEQADKLQADPEHLARLLEHAGEPAVLVVDQFEEIFALCKDNRTQQAFIDSLLSLLQNEEPRHRVILTMRSDYATHIVRYQELERRWKEAKISVTPLGPAELREAIERPAAQAGLKFEDRLVAKLVDDILGEPAGLPLLQFTLLKLWESRERNRVTWAAYQRLGGCRMALAHCADELYDSLIPEEQVTAKRILLQMVQPSEGLEVTSNRVPKENLDRIGEDPGRVKRVLDKLIDARLIRLTPGETLADDQVEVAHEALVRNWPKLVDWLDQSRVELVTGRRLKARADEWERLGNSKSELLSRQELRDAERWLTSTGAKDFGYDKRITALVAASRKAIVWRKRGLRVLLGGLGLFILAYIAAGFGSFYFGRQAFQAKTEAVSAATERDQAKIEAVSAATARDQAKTEAVSAATERDQAKIETAIAMTARDQAKIEAANATTARDQAKVQAATATAERDQAKVETTKAMMERGQAKLETANATTARDQAKSQAEEAQQKVVQLQAKVANLQNEKDQLSKGNEQKVADGGFRPQDERGVLPQIGRVISDKFSFNQFRGRHRPVMTGFSTSSQEPKSLTGTICCVVRDAQGTYLLSRASVFRSPGTGVLQPSAADSLMPRASSVVAKVERRGPNENRSGAIARLSPRIIAKSEVPGLGPIVGMAENVSEGTSVCLAGRGSGLRCDGTIRSIEKDDDGNVTTIVTDIVPAAGDTGAPLLTQDHRLIGMLWGWSTQRQESYVTPIQTIFDELKVELVPGESPRVMVHPGR